MENIFLKNKKIFGKKNYKNDIKKFFFLLKIKIYRNI